MAYETIEVRKTTPGPEFTPSWDLDWELVRFGNRDQIVAVFVAGQLRLWRGWPANWDALALLREVKAVAAETVAKAPIKRIHPVSREHRTRHSGPAGKHK